MNIKRQIYNELDRWLSSVTRRPLLVRGARQVGKSFAIRHWAKQRFDNLLEINLEEQESLRVIFQRDLSADRILDNLELATGVNLRRNGSALFIDEIQSEPRALLALRYLYEQCTELPVIAAGSLVEFILEHIGLPVGRVDQLHMKPLGFCEFLEALNKEHLAAQIFKNDFSKPLAGIAHQQLLELLRIYYYVGGMPEAVAAYAQSRELAVVSDIHARLLTGYEDDFQRYSKNSDWAALRTVYHSATNVVGESRVKYVRLDRELRGEKVKSALNLLIKAQVLSKIVSTYAKTLPLKSSVKEKFFKLIFVDIGLLHHALGFDWRSVDLEDDLTDIRDGAFAEQFVGQELLSTCSINTSRSLYYWYRAEKGSDAEVDYIVNYAGEPTPVEVKSGARGTLKSLSLYMTTFQPTNGFVLSQRNVEQLESTIFLPLYMACRL